MATDYEEYYRDKRNALGAPTKEFVDFFRTFDVPNAWVLDIGCGQGRDALHIARLGHRVLGVDLAATGIRHLLEDASKEGLDIEAEVADIRTFVPSRNYDVIVIDRTLHMLQKHERTDVLRRLLDCTTSNAAVLIADERSNIAAFEAVFAESEVTWDFTLRKSGYLFACRTC